MVSMDEPAALSLSDGEFETAVGDALDLIPDELAKLMSNVAVLIEPEPSPDDPELLGLYEGIPLTERDGWYDAGSLPDRITIYQGPLQRYCRDREELLDEIAVTVVHEVAHHFGVDDTRLHELGWGLTATRPRHFRCGAHLDVDHGPGARVGTWI